MNIARIQETNVHNWQKTQGLKKSVMNNIGNQYANNTMHLVDTNNMKAFIKAPKSIVAFKGALVPETKLSNELNAVWSKMKRNEIAIITNNFDKTIEDIKSNGLPFLKFIVNRVFVIKNDKFESNLLAYKNNDSIKKVVNLGKAKGCIYTGGDIPFKPLESYKPESVYDGNKILLNHEQILVSDNVSETAYQESTNAVESFPLTSWDPHCIEELNKKHISEVKTLFNEPKQNKIMFSDIGGQAQAIARIKESILAPLLAPDLYKSAVGAKNCGAILYGPPGTGKTLLAKALANEAGMNFMVIDPNGQADMYVGESERKWREVFDNAIKKEPCIVFIDEADAAMKNREGSTTSRHDDKIVNQVLTKMDELAYGNHNVFVILATNKIELMDGAIRRSQRFGEHIGVPKPDLQGCKEILKIHSKGEPFDKDVNPEILAQKFYEKNCTGADFPFIITKARSKALTRLHLVEKILAHKFDPVEDMKNFKIKNEDFEKAFAEFEPDNSQQQERIHISGYRVTK
jgi:ATP-dependent 26S proteasome regulatory subunit